MIRSFTYTVIAGGLLMLASMVILIWPVARAKADAAPYVIGDSICEGVMIVSGAPGYARRGARTASLRSWLYALPRGSKVAFCSGTNDAVFALVGFDTAVEEIVTAAKKKNLKLIWVGPVRSDHAWDRYSDKADTHLALRLSVAGVQYVSLRAIKFERADLARDGVHFSPRGYRRIASMVMR